LVVQKMTKQGFLLSLFVMILSRYNDDALIQTNSGMIQGELTPKVKMFRSIPYANPPINELRWELPEYIESWGNNTINALNDPPGCPQACYLPPLTCPQTINEDCLYLNIFTPLYANITSQFPVLLFIHGGNFLQGYGGGLLYNATDFVYNRDVIVVTINYRLGALGFLYSDEAGMSGNYGYYDQKMAIEWIHNNIEYFGGNKDEITLYGQSAGAISVALHISDKTDESVNQFKRGIMESEPFGTPLRSTKTWGDLPRVFIKNTGCNIDSNHDELWTCLRSLSMETILYAQNKTENDGLVEFDHFMQLFMPWTPTVGTDIISDQPIRLFQNGDTRDISFISGTVYNEGTEFIYLAYPNGVTKEQVPEILGFLMTPSDALKVIEAYPLPNNTSDYRDYLSLIATDGLFKCPTRNATASHVSQSSFKSLVYNYHFNHASSFNNQSWGPNYTCCWGNIVCHGEELTYIFNTDLTPINATNTANEASLAYYMDEYWYQFSIGNGPGNGGNNINWKPFTLSNQESMIFDINTLVIKNNVDINDSKCAFWDTLDFNWIR